MKEETSESPHSPTEFELFNPINMTLPQKLLLFRVGVGHIAVDFDVFFHVIIYWKSVASCPNHGVEFIFNVQTAHAENSSAQAGGIA